MAKREAPAHRSTACVSSSLDVTAWAKPCTIGLIKHKCQHSPGCRALDEHDDVAGREHVPPGLGLAVDVESLGMGGAFARAVQVASAAAELLAKSLSGEALKSLAARCAGDVHARPPIAHVLHFGESVSPPEAQRRTAGP